MKGFNHSLGQLPRIMGLSFGNLIIVVLATLIWVVLLLFASALMEGYAGLIFISIVYCGVLIYVIYMQIKFNGNMLATYNQIKKIRPKMSDILKLFTHNQK